MFGVWRRTTDASSIVLPKAVTTATQPEHIPETSPAKSPQTATGVEAAGQANSSKRTWGWALGRGATAQPRAFGVRPS